MFRFTWIDSNKRKNDIVVNGHENAIKMYNILHDNVKAYDLKCLASIDNVEAYVVFINNIMVTV